MSLLNGRRVAALVADGFELVELSSPREALERAGATVHIISPNAEKVQGWNHYEKDQTFDVDVQLSAANAEEYDALLLPGGVANPDQLRANPDAVKFVQAFFRSGKPIGAICHAPWLLIEAGIVKGYNMTSYTSIRTDLKNAGAIVHDKEVVIDRGLVTSRDPGDLMAFNQAIIEEFCEGRHGTGTGDRTQARGE